MSDGDRLARAHHQAAHTINIAIVQGARLDRIRHLPAPSAAEPGVQIQTPTSNPTEAAAIGSPASELWWRYVEAFETFTATLIALNRRTERHMCGPPGGGPDTDNNTNTERTWCSNCNHGPLPPGARVNGMCRPCDAYQRKYGRARPWMLDQTGHRR